MLYGLVVIIPYVVLHDIWRSDGSVIIIDLILLLVPFFCILFIANVNLNLPECSFFSEKMVVWMIFMVSILAVLLLLLRQPLTASFSLDDAYIRRLEARDIYGAGTFQAYISSMVMNSALPLFTFLGIFQRRVIYLLVGFILYLVFFYIFGVKAPVLYMIFAGLFACFVKINNGVGYFYLSIYYLFISCFSFAWLEFFLFDNSFVEDYLIRRLFYVPSYLIGAYFNFIDSDIFSWVSGLLVPTSKSISFYIGEDFLGLPGTNANTNTFLYYLAQYGFFGYVFIILLVGFFVLFLNSLRFKSEVFVFLLLMFSVLILEQSATTTLLSSGIGVLAFLFYFAKTSKVSESAGVKK